MISPQIFLILALLVQQMPASLHTMVLRVTDPWGLPVAGAQVIVANVTLATDGAGELVLPSDLPEEFEIRIASPGMEPIHTSAGRWTGTEEMQLKLGSVLAGITVTASRVQRLATETPSSVTVLDSENIRTSPSRAVDDMLRQVPGFSLLRRSGSVAAHPTSQGVSMRGVGASGASRTLVLADGIPVNDAFGTWVYWNRVPKASIESIEVVRGGASHLYGSSAVGGVIHMRTRRPEEKTFVGEFTYGKRQLAQGSIFTSDVQGNWGYSFASELFHTDGYLSTFVPGQNPHPGLIDEPVAVQHQTGVFHLERRIGGGSRAYSRLLYSNEDRKNGTPLTRNDTQFRQMILGAEIPHRFGRTGIHAYGGSESFDSTFSSVAGGRRFETLTSTQHVPLGFGGVQGATLLSFGRNSFAFGLEFRQARGTSNEIQFRNNAVSARIKNGGSQQTFAPFVEHIVAVNSRGTLTWSLRWDRWRNLDLSGNDAVQTRWSPKLGGSYRFSSNVTAHAAGYGAFRAPTLNELYRPFSIGNAVTQANPLLGDERLRGGEAGVAIQAMNGRIHGRIGAYAARLSGTIANITLVASPLQTIRQRRNLGTARARGLETEIEVRPLRTWSITGSYLLADSVVTRFPTQVALEGKRIPQVARHQFSIQALGSFLDAYRINVQARTASVQYDDDLNSFPLEGYFVVDAFAARSVGSHFELFLAGENLSNREIQITRTAALLGLGMPRTVRGGLMVKFGAR